MSVVVWRCARGHELSVDDGGKPEALSSEIAVRQMGHVAAEGCKVRGPYGKDSEGRIVHEACGKPMPRVPAAAAFDPDGTMTAGGDL